MGKPLGKAGRHGPAHTLQPEPSFVLPGPQATLRATLTAEGLQTLCARLPREEFVRQCYREAAVLPMFLLRDQHTMTSERMRPHIEYSRQSAYRPTDHIREAVFCEDREPAAVSPKIGDYRAEPATAAEQPGAQDAPWPVPRVPPIERPASAPRRPPVRRPSSAREAPGRSIPLGAATTPVPGLAGASQRSVQGSFEQNLQSAVDWAAAGAPKVTQVQPRFPPPAVSFPPAASDGLAATGMSAGLPAPTPAPEAATVADAMTSVAQSTALDPYCASGLREAVELAKRLVAKRAGAQQLAAAARQAQLEVADEGGTRLAQRARARSAMDAVRRENCPRPAKLVSGRADVGPVWGNDIGMRLNLLGLRPIRTPRTAPPGMTATMAAQHARSSPRGRGRRPRQHASSSARTPRR